VPGSFQVAAFLDTGEVTLLEKPFAPLPNHRRLSSGGLSLGWGKAGDFSLRATVAHRIGNARATAGTDVETRGWLQAIKNF
jgi:hemolysin activation/secretion protein